MPVVIDCINRSAMPEPIFNSIVLACQKYIDNTFSREWDSPVTLVRSQLETVPADSWEFTLLDTSDQVGSAGYHERTALGQPTGKAFYKTELEHMLTPSVTISHELMEMLADPDINRTVLTQAGPGIRLWAYEVCDAVENEVYALSVDGLKMSNFVTRGWFIPGYKGQTDAGSATTQPFQIAPGGYIGVFDIQPNRPFRGWTIVQNALGHRHTFSPRREYRFNSEWPN